MERAILNNSSGEIAFQEQLLRKIPSNPHLRKLYNQHRKLDREVENLVPYAAYSSSAALRLRALKKEKLRRREQMMAVVSADTVD